MTREKEREEVWRKLDGAMSLSRITALATLAIAEELRYMNESKYRPTQHELKYDTEPVLSYRADK